MNNNDKINYPITYPAPGIIPIIVAIVILFIIINLFSWAYNSPAFAENTCRDEKLSFGYDCRVVINQSSEARAEIFKDGNWVNICDSNVGHYCDALN